VIAQTGRFKVYRTVMTRQAKNNRLFTPAARSWCRWRFPGKSAHFCSNQYNLHN
jgi:hypothetical protein